MSATKSRDWIQIAGNFSVVAGLVLVAFQINQSSYLVRAELGSNSYSQAVSIEQLAVDPELAEVLAKSLERPEDLTVSEMIQLEGYFNSLVIQLAGDNWLYELDIFEGSLDEDLPYFVAAIGGNRFALSWWIEVRQTYPPAFVERVDTQLANPPFKIDIDRYRRIQSRF
jgi:hypothetical protein